MYMYFMYTFQGEFHHFNGNHAEDKMFAFQAIGKKKEFLLQHLQLIVKGIVMTNVTTLMVSSPLSIDSPYRVAESSNL